MIKPPKIGQWMTVHGMRCYIVKIYPAGTVDVVAPDGRFFRVTGLGFA